MNQFVFLHLISYNMPPIHSQRRRKDEDDLFGNSGIKRYD